MKDLSQTKFPSKRDWWLGSILWLPLLAFLVLSVVDQNWWATLILIASCGLIGVMWFGTVYEIEGDTLYIRVGPLKYSPISITKIKSLKPSKTLLAGPASSLDRFIITVDGSGPAIVSPKDKAGFVKALQAINPEIQFDGIK